MTSIESPSERIKLLVSQLIDGQLSTEQANELNCLARADARNLEYVVDQLLLDSLLSDELGGESLTALVDLVADGPVVSGKINEKTTPGKVVTGMVGWFGVMAATACSLLLATIFLSHMFGQTAASAAVTELSRIIAVTSKPGDRTYQMAVEEAMSPPLRGQGAKSPDHGRPPKPPMDGAVLHVGGGHQFVLVRMTQDGLPFVTGCNGQTSWAVRPDGPVRVSSDLGRFSRDVPGHEHSMPLINIQDGLERLREAYEVQLLPVEEPEDKSSLDDDGPSRLLVAVKKRSYRGPKRVEITYSVRSGLIRQMRFVEMPYGPQRLTMRMTLVEGQQLGETFFNHESHHAVDQVIEFED